MLLIDTVKGFERELYVSIGVFRGFKNSGLGLRVQGFGWGLGFGLQDLRDQETSAHGSSFPQALNPEPSTQDPN